MLTRLRTHRLLFVVLLALASTAQRTVPDSQEVAILEAVVADPYLCEVNNRWNTQGLAMDLSLGRTTELLPIHDEVTPQKSSLTILFDGKPYAVEPELIDARQQQNRRRISLRKIKLPLCPGMVQSGKRQRRVVTFSRPGISGDGTTAIVAVTLRWRTNGYVATGYTVHLRRDVGGWRIDGRSPGWIEEV